MSVARAIATLVLVVMLGEPTSVHAEKISVCAFGCDHSSINAAIDASSDGDVILLASEIYVEKRAIDLDGKAITLRGSVDAEGRALTILDGIGAHPLLRCRNSESGSTRFENLVLIRGRALSGSGFYGFGASPTFINCHFAENVNSAMRLARRCEPTLIGCTFTANKSDDWGGALHLSESDATLIECVFQGNTAPKGGAIHSLGGRPTFIDCAFTHNSANLGGAIHHVGRGGPVIQDGLFRGNVAITSGGGLYNEFGTPKLIGCSFEGDEAASGGTLTSFQANPILIDCRFIGDPPPSIQGGVTSVAGPNRHGNGIDEPPPPLESRPPLVPVFPDDFAGKWQGTLRLHEGLDAGAKEVELMLDVRPDPGGSGSLWRFTQSRQPPRERRVVESNAELGEYLIDEGDGVVLPARFLADTLVWRFKTAGQMFLARMRFRPEVIDYEILAGPVDAAPPGEDVDGLRVNGLQRATLRRVLPPNR